MQQHIVWAHVQLAAWSEQAFPRHFSDACPRHIDDHLSTSGQSFVGSLLEMLVQEL